MSAWVFLLSELFTSHQPVVATRSAQHETHLWLAQDQPQIPPTLPPRMFGKDRLPNIMPRNPAAAARDPDSDREPVGAAETVSDAKPPASTPPVGIESEQPKSRILNKPESDIDLFLIARGLIESPGVFFTF